MFCSMGSVAMSCDLYCSILSELSLLTVSLCNYNKTRRRVAYFLTICHRQGIRTMRQHCLRQKQIAANDYMVCNLLSVNSVWYGMREQICFSLLKMKVTKTIFCKVMSLSSTKRLFVFHYIEALQNYCINTPLGKLYQCDVIAMLN